MCFVLHGALPCAALALLTIFAQAGSADPVVRTAKDEPHSAGPERSAAIDPARRAITFDDFGALGDGRHDDQAAIQAAVEAAAGGTIFGVEGRTYTLRGQVYIPSNTVIDCRGATVQFDPTLGNTFVNALFWVGYSNGDAGMNIEIRHCNVVSTLKYENGAINFQPGSAHIKIFKNDFTNTAGYALRAVNIRTSRIHDVEITYNTSQDIAYLVYLDGDETQTWQHCVDVSHGTTCRGVANPPPANTTQYAVPAALQADIAKGFGYGVMIDHHNNGFNSRRLFGPYDKGADFTYSDGVIEFAEPLPTDHGVEVSLFTWNPAVQPANDARNLVISGNVGKRFRAAAVQINCPVRAYHRRTPFVDCPRNIAVVRNKFDGTYQLEGMFNSFQTGLGKTNKVLWSQDFTNPVWIRDGLLPPMKGLVSPPFDQTPSAQRLAEASSTGHHAVRQNVNVKAGEPHTWSCSMKPAGRSKFRLNLLTNIGNGVTALFDLATASVINNASVGTGKAEAAGLNGQGDGWYRAWVSGTLDAAASQPSIYLEDPAGKITYPGDGASGIAAWGCQLEAGTSPSVYMPTQRTPARSISAQLISINGVDDFSVAENELGPAADQCIHLEDYAGHGSVVGNTCRDAGGAGIYAISSRSVAIKNNVVLNSYTGCVLLDGRDPSPPMYTDPTMENKDISLDGNKCDGQNNPHVSFGYHIGSRSGQAAIPLQDNSAVNLPAGVLVFRCGSGDCTQGAQPSPSAAHPAR